MNADQDVSVGIDLQQITVQGVKPKATDRKRRVVLELEDLLRVSHMDQTLFDEIEAECFILRRFIL